MSGGEEFCSPELSGAPGPSPGSPSQTTRAIYQTGSEGRRARGVCQGPGSLPLLFDLACRRENYHHLENSRRYITGRYHCLLNSSYQTCQNIMLEKCCCGILNVLFSSMHTMLKKMCWGWYCSFASGMSVTFNLCSSSKNRPLLYIFNISLSLWCQNMYWCQNHYNSCDISADLFHFLTSTTLPFWSNVH